MIKSAVNLRVVEDHTTKNIFFSNPSLTFYNSCVRASEATIVNNKLHIIANKMYYGDMRHVSLDVVPSVGLR